MNKRFLKVLVLLCLAHTAQAAQLTWQALEAPVKNFLQAELKARAASFKLGKPSSNLRLPECAALAVGWPPGVPASGATFVEVSCPNVGWSVRYPVTIDEKRMGVLTTRQLQPGETVSASDVRLAELPNPALASNVLSSAEDAVGKLVRGGIMPGMWLRGFMLQAPQVVRSNQQVRVVAEDGTFSVAADGIATNNAAIGEPVSVRMPSGRQVRGIARADGSVGVRY